MPPSQPPPWTGEEPRLPPRPRGGLGWGRCLNLTAKTLTTCSPVQAELKALWARREPLVQQVEREKKRLQTVQSEAVRASLARTLAVLKDEIAPIEARVEALIASDADLSQKAALLQTAVGVGRVVAYGLVAALPEFGQVSHRAIAALAGLAPVRCESGDWVGRARVRGGRPRVRRLLYQAAVVAVDAR
jgi:transposase